MPILWSTPPAGACRPGTGSTASARAARGLIHAQLLCRTVRARLDDPAALAHVWDEHTETFVAPFYRNQIAADRARVAEMEALCYGLDKIDKVDGSTPRWLPGPDRDQLLRLLSA